MKAVYLEWDDSSVTHGWTETRDIDHSLVVKTVGWLVEDADDYVTVSTSFDDAKGWLSALVIPKSAIKRRLFVDAVPE